MINKDNQKKALSGQDFKKFLTEKFNSLKNEGLIKNYLEEQKYSHKGFNYKHAYLANFVIETVNSKFIVIRSSTSYRNDRAKQMQWDLDGINKNSNISKRIIASVLLFNDNQRDRIKHHKEGIRRKEIYSPASHLLTVNEFIEFLDNYTADLGIVTSQERGRMHAKGGIKKEKELVKNLNDYENLAKLKKSELKDDNDFKQILTTICNRNSLAVDKINYIKATDTVPLLASGGSAKADIVISIFCSDKTLIQTISVKNSSEAKVSCHEYRVSDFIRVLGCKGTKLAEYLLKFQENPTYKDFKANLRTLDSEEEFEALMAPYARKLTEWALTGEHDNEKIIDSTRQVAQYLFINSATNSHCYLLAEYMDYLFSVNKKFKFGVPFSWTYSSGQRGKSIQLKVPLTEIKS